MKQSTRKKILLADDQESIRRLVGATLGGEQFELVYASDGDEAVRVATDHQPDLVLLDVGMPKIDGYQACRLIKTHSSTAGIRVIMLTALGRDEDRERGVAAGADDYIVKPFSPLALLRKVQILLGETEGPPPVLSAAPVVAASNGPAGVGFAAELLVAATPGLLAVDHLSLEEKVEELESSQHQLLIYAEELNQAYRELQSTYFSTLQALAAAIDARDPYTYGHSQRVASYAVEIARIMGLGPDQLETIRRAGLLHDIGKIGVPDATLRKPGKLTEEEWNEIMKHPVIGYQMVSGLKFLTEAAPFICAHHERYDGRGYPYGLRALEIPLGARILSVADSFDAMTTTRPYRPALSIPQARDEAERCRNTQFDTHVVDAFQDGIETIETIFGRETHRQETSGS